MRVLGIDPGAEHLGWAVIQKEKDGPKYVGSGVFGVKREEKEKYQPYKLRLIQFWVKHTDYLLDSYVPDLLVSEIIPVVGGGNFVAATQSQLAATAITTIQAIAGVRGYKIEQVAANTVKKRIGGKKDATKVQVRNGVYRQLPELKVRGTEWTKHFDEPDAIAIALTHLGYTN